MAQWPDPSYRSLESTSYNRESTHRDAPGWFADSDGTGFIREESGPNGKEYVIMEHDGPGAITKMWTPFFYYDFNNRKGPNIRIYLDGNSKPVIDENFIAFVCGHGSAPEPFARYTARAGNCYLPIPFAKSARVVLTDRPFYFSVNYRDYPDGTKVETYKPSDSKSRKTILIETASRLLEVPHVEPMSGDSQLKPGDTTSLDIRGARAISQLSFEIPMLRFHPEWLRSLVLSIKFDGVETVWCPIGDFFSTADSLHAYSTQARTVLRTDRLFSQFVMPFKDSATVSLHNFGQGPIPFLFRVEHRSWTWDERSMHFYAAWRPDEIVPGSPFSDWNFVDISGRGVYVADSWTVLNIRPNSWWGEGDEKIYVDGDWERGFPSHFGTGSEDYYGWAGGVYPVKEDEFSNPWLANVCIGGRDGHTQGYNILTRTRSLDAIPFQSRLRFDMEASFGTDMRAPWDLLGYSAVTMFYALPGATHNRPARPNAASQPILSIEDIQHRREQLAPRDSQ